MHARGKMGRARRHRKLLYIEKLLRSCDVLCLQETHLGAHDKSALNLYFPNHEILYNNFRLRRAGTLILVSKRYARLQTISVVSLGEDAKGWLQAIQVAPVEGEAGEVHIIVNFYGPSGDRMEERLGLLDQLRGLELRGNLFLVGDFNMIDESRDATSPDASIILAGAHRERWNNLLSDMALQEVRQDTHTYYCINDEDPRSSRIDRIYISMSNADRALVTPLAHVEYAGPGPALLARDIAAGKGVSSKLKKLHVSDHVPVALTFEEGRRYRSAFKAPSWLAQDEELIRKIRDAWTGFEGEDTCSPFQAILDWKATVKTCVLNHFKNARGKLLRYRSELAELNTAVALLRACKRVHQDGDHIRSLMHRHAHLAGLTAADATGYYPVEKVAAFVDNVFTDATTCAAKDASTGEDLPLPPSFVPGAAKGAQDPITKIKARLPATRERLLHLRSSEHDQPTSDPEAMGGIIQEHYQKVFDRDEGVAGRSEIHEYLQEVQGRLPSHLVPDPPGLDTFIDVIAATNDSCAGPDGIPFAFYRAFTKIDRSLAAALTAAASQLGEGGLPPEGYNHAWLFLIPKKAGGLIDDTRGISVTNGDNRIVASAFAEAITPALQSFIGADQKGFVRGREGAGHVHALTNSFYAKLSKKEQQYILLLDMKRAFDSVAHQFIHACLNHFGFPGWFCRAIVGLLHQVTIFPVLAKRTKHRIDIWKGVKQGCPLSPLLFIICFEVLLRLLRAKSDRLHLYAFADDLATAVGSFTLLLRTLAVVSRFSTFSGLFMNLLKTVIVATLPPSRSVQARLTASPWAEVKFANSAKYLGVLVGPRVSTVDIARKAKDDFFARLRRFGPALKTSSLHDRITIFNTFLLPLFFYLAQFVVLPWHELVQPVTTACHRNIVAFNGGGFGYAHLVTPRGCGFSLYTPLRDLWAWNMALLGYDYDLERSTMAPTPVMGEDIKVGHYSGLNNTLRVRDHKAYGAFVLLHDHSPRRHGLIDLSALPAKDKPARRRRWCYNQLALSGYKGARDGVTKATSLPCKLHKLLGTGATVVKARHAAAHARSTIHRLTPAKWNTHFRFVMRALPFDKRRAEAHMPVRHPMCCYMCGVGQDSAAHIFECLVVQEARALLKLKTQMDITDEPEEVALAKAPSHYPLHTMLIVTLNWAVWHLRTTFFATLLKPPPTGTAAERIVDCTLHHLRLEGDRTPGTVQRLVALATQPPKTVAVAFTDGSEKDGRCGAGFTVEAPGRTIEKYSHYLGLGGTNNDAEMGALKGALRRLLELQRAEGFKQAILFSDSACCLGYLIHGWKSPIQDLVMARETRRLYHLAQRRMDIRMYWIRGHAGIPGNELADDLARQGMEGRTTAEWLNTDSDGMDN